MLPGAADYMQLVMLQKLIFTGKKFPFGDRVEHRFHYPLMANDEDSFVRPFFCTLKKRCQYTILYRKSGFATGRGKFPTHRHSAGKVFFEIFMDRGDGKPFPVSPVLLSQSRIKGDGQVKLSVDDVDSRFYSAQITGEIRHPVR